MPNPPQLALLDLQDHHLPLHFHITAHATQKCSKKEFTFQPQRIPKPYSVMDFCLSQCSVVVTGSLVEHMLGLTNKNMSKTHKTSSSSNPSCHICFPPCLWELLFSQSATGRAEAGESVIFWWPDRCCWDFCKEREIFDHRLCLHLAQVSGFDRFPFTLQSSFWEMGRS